MTYSLLHLQRMPIFFQIMIKNKEGIVKNP